MSIHNAYNIICVTISPEIQKFPCLSYHPVLFSSVTQFDVYPMHDDNNLCLKCANIVYLHILRNVSIVSSSSFISVHHLFLPKWWLQTTFKVTQRTHVQILWVTCPGTKIQYLNLLKFTAPKWCWIWDYRIVSGVAIRFTVTGAAIHKLWKRKGYRQQNGNQNSNLPELDLETLL